MLGCFNNVLFLNFDTQRLFDIINFRTWDFIIWWFDVTLILFEFNLDFFINVSYLFIFLINFYIKIYFSCIMLILNLNKKIILKILNLHINMWIIMFISYFILNSFMYVIMLAELLLFSYNYTIYDVHTQNVDILINNTALCKNKKNYIDMITFYIILYVFKHQSLFLNRTLNIHSFVYNLYINYIYTITGMSVIKYYFNVSLILYKIFKWELIIDVLKLNIIIQSALLSLFFSFYILNKNMLFKKYVLYLHKNSNFFCSLTNNMILNIFKFLYADICIGTILIFILLFINFFGFFIKDVILFYTYSILPNYFISLCTYKELNIYVFNVSKFYKTKLIYLL